MKHLIERFLHIMLTLEQQVLQILANQATILGNQATIIQNQATALTAIQAITPGDSSAITAALATMETQLTDIASQVDVVNTAATPTPSPSPAPGSSESGTAGAAS